MGFLATLLLSVIFAILGIVRPRLAVYLILTLFVFFDEMGPGFTTYRGSFMFNAFFVGFYGLRLVEVLTLSAYVSMSIMARNRGQASLPFRAERAISAMFFLWVGVLLAVEYGISGKVTHSDWRLIVTGAMQFHMFVLMFRDEAAVGRLVRFFLILLTLKALYGLGMYAAGYGVHTPRGRLPFFWDSRQVEAFGLGVVILTGYLLNYGSINIKYRFLPSFVALFMWLVLVVAVGGSIRRTVWVSTFVGMLGVLVLSRRTTVLHYFTIVFAGAIVAAGLLLAPGLDDFRDHMGKYVKSLNLLNAEEIYANAENAVHVYNVEQYYKMVTEKTDILALGIHGPTGTRSEGGLREEYTEGFNKLGLAHNGILRSILFFGVSGALLYVGFFSVAIVRTWRIYRQADEEHVLKHIGIACGVYMFLDFVPTLLFVPPFYTTSKGLFYIFLAAFIVGSTSFHLVTSKKKSRSKREVGVHPMPIERSPQHA